MPFVIIVVINVSLVFIEHIADLFLKRKESYNRSLHTAQPMLDVDRDSGVSNKQTNKSPVLLVLHVVQHIEWK